MTNIKKVNPSQRSISIYCDGACKENPGIGGYGYVIEKDGRSYEGSGAVILTTNNQMELTAVIKALEKIKKPSILKITCDSQYVVKGITTWIHDWVDNDWKSANKKPVKNKELWQNLFKLASKHQISWFWVKGHSGHPQNERCDELANNAIKKLLKKNSSPL